MPLIKLLCRGAWDVHNARFYTENESEKKEENYERFYD